MINMTEKYKKPIIIVVPYMPVEQHRMWRESIDKKFEYCLLVSNRNVENFKIITPRKWGVRKIKKLIDKTKKEIASIKPKEDMDVNVDHSKLELLKNIIEDKDGWKNNYKEDN